MQIAILSSASGWHVDDLRRAATARGHLVKVAAWTDLRGTVGGDGVGVACADLALHEVDAVILRIMPCGSLEQIILRMDVLRQLESCGVYVVNPPTGAEIAIDKYLALLRMAEAGLPVPETVVCQRPEDALRAMAALGGDVVVKPIFGSEGKGVTRVSRIGEAATHFSMLCDAGSVLYVQRFVEHERGDLRLFVVGDRVIAAMRRMGTGAEWRANVALGGRGEPYVPDADLQTLAISATRACGLVVAGVDIIVDRAGQPFVLEVNGCPGWRELTRVTGVDVADHLIRHIEARVARESPRHVA